MEQRSKKEIHDECEARTRQLIVQAQRFLKSEKDREYRNTEISKTEICTGANIHRGYYCPSPVFDLLVGNTHRGRLLHRPNCRTRPSHTYHFGAQGELLYVESPGTVEYLVRERSSRYGYSFATYGLVAVTMEVFRDGKISECLRSLVSPYALKEGLLRGDATYETYSYEGDRIAICDQYFVVFGHPEIVNMEKYRLRYEEDHVTGFWFLREDGSLRFEEPCPCKPRDLSKMILDEGKVL